MTLVNIKKYSTMICIIVLVILCSIIVSVNGFNSSTLTIRNKAAGGHKKRYSLIGQHVPSNSSGKTMLQMAKESGPSKKKRRKRKKESERIDMPLIPQDDMEAIKEMTQSGGDRPSLDDLRAIADFQAPKGKSSGSSNFVEPKSLGGETFVELPDIRDALKNKEMKKIQEVEEQKQQRKKISRKDTKAFLELLEAEPFADADDSYFEEEEYGTVSALLAEGAKPFLGIPPGPLQVGHFIGALVIILCAFIDYPGFPLTNLPTPLREGLQGGLGVVYLINTLLAVLAVFKAPERGQPAVLWAIKTFSVGGLALDQLTQLPTLKEVEEIKNRKGARAIKKNKK